MALQSLQRLPELLFYTKKSYRILQFKFYKGTHTHTSYINPENSPSRIQFYMQKTKSSFEYYYYIQNAKRPSFQKRNSTYRRQGNLLEIHPCVLQDLPKTFQAFQPQDLPKAFQTFQSLQTFQTFQPIQAILQVPVSPGNPPHSSIPRLECIFYIFYKFYSSIGFHRKLHRVPVGQYKLQTFILQRKGDVAISVRIDRFSRIELFPSNVLSSEKTNYKNDIQ